MYIYFTYTCGFQSHIIPLYFAIKLPKQFCIVAKFAEILLENFVDVPAYAVFVIFECPMEFIQFIRRHFLFFPQEIFFSFISKNILYLPLICIFVCIFIGTYIHLYKHLCVIDFCLYFCFLLCFARKILT